MIRATTRGRFLPACLAAAAWLLAPDAGAAASTAIDVTNLRVSVAAIDPGSTPGVSFTGPGGSTSQCTVSSGTPPATWLVTANGRGAFGEATAAASGDPFAGSAAMLSGDVFGAGGFVHTSAFTGGPEPGVTSQGTVGLADGVSAIAFTLAPGTRLTITADVWATASVTGASPMEFADSGFSFALSDADGVGPQFARVTFDAIALGLFGPVDDVESTTLSLVYENTSDVAITGLFSGYVSSVATSGDAVGVVPEPGSAAMLSLGLLLVAGTTTARRRHRRPARK
jgi:hypothetical protein